MTSRANDGSFFLKMRIIIIGKSVIFTPLKQIFVKQETGAKFIGLSFRLYLR